MRQWYPYSIKWEKINGLIFHITVFVAMFLLFYDDKNTDSKLLEMEISIPELILTHINILRHYVTNIPILYKMGEKEWGNSSYYCFCSHIPAIL